MIMMMMMMLRVVVSRADYSVPTALLLQAPDLDLLLLSDLSVDLFVSPSVCVMYSSVSQFKPFHMALYSNGPELLE